MKAVQILMDDDLVAALDRQAKRMRSSRSDLIRKAVARYLAEQRRAECEARHRRGYERHPQVLDEIEEWEAIQVWPED